MEELLSKIYDKVVFYEQESITLGRELDVLVDESLKPLENVKTETEIEDIKELIYNAVYSAEKDGFYMGVHFAAKLFAEIMGGVKENRGNKEKCR